MMYVKMDVYRVTERREGAVYKTKKVAYHWFEAGRGPEPYDFLRPEIVAQNGLEAGDYYYASTLDTVIDTRCPKGGLYK